MSERERRNLARDGPRWADNLFGSGHRVEVPSNRAPATSSKPPRKPLGIASKPPTSGVYRTASDARSISQDLRPTQTEGMKPEQPSARGQSSGPSTRPKRNPQTQGQATAPSTLTKPAASPVRPKARTAVAPTRKSKPTSSASSAPATSPRPQARETVYRESLLTRIKRRDEEARSRR